MESGQYQSALLVLGRKELLCNRGRDFDNHPTNDWRLATLLHAMFAADQQIDLLSVNSQNAEAWAETLEGIRTLSNDGMNCWETSINSDSSQTAVVIEAILTKQSQSRGGIFHAIEELLSIPEVTAESPWLDLNSPSWYRTCLDDAAFEAVPAQLLARVRIGPIGFIERTHDGLLIRFTAWQGESFELQGSSDLKIWDGLRTFETNHGEFTHSILPTAPHSFFRVRMLP